MGTGTTGQVVFRGAGDCGVGEPALAFFPWRQISSGHRISLICWMKRKIAFIWEFTKMTRALLSVIGAAPTNTYTLARFLLLKFNRNKTVYIFWYLAGENFTTGSSQKSILFTILHKRCTIKYLFPLLHTMY